MAKALLTIHKHSVMNFSTILDISSFFIGVIINLLVVALMCYYFKRKYDALEMAQNEQAKILYDLLQKEKKQILSTTPTEDALESFNYPLFRTRHENEVLDHVEVDDEADDEADDEVDDEEVDNEVDDEDDDVKDKPTAEEIKYMDEITIEIGKEVDPIVEFIKIEQQEINDDVKEDVKVVEDNEKKNGEDYSKMSMKQLKDLLTTKGVKVKSGVNKNELISLAERTTDIKHINLSVEP
jgi:hypothetical protein